MQKIGNSVLRTLIICGLVLTTTGCDPIATTGELSLSIDEEGHALLGVCTTGTVDYLMATYSPNRSVTREIVVEGEGSPIQLLQGDVFVLGDHALGFSYSKFELPPLKENSQLAVILNLSSEEFNLSGQFQIPGRSLTPGEWLFPDGSISDSVCGGYGG